MALLANELPNLSCPEGKEQVKHYDSNGLYLLLKSNSSKLWRFRFKYADKHQEMALGKYPKIPIKKAREMAEKARLSLVQGINQMDERRENKRVKNTPEGVFNKVALKWWENQNETWNEDHAARIKRWIDNEMKSLGKLAVEEIDTGHITELILKLEAAGTPKKAPTILSIINRIFGYALAHRLTRTNPAQGLPLSDINKPLPKVRSHSAIVKPTELGKLIQAIDNTQTGSYCTSEALKLIPRIFLRPNEISSLKWEYVDFDEKLIRIPAQEMKRDREHLVPLAQQVIEQLREIQSITGYSEYVFPNHRDASKPISKNVITNRLRDLGYSADVMKSQGFRSTASTILHEQGWHHEVIETQLAHLIGSATTRAYNRSIYSVKRRKMMQKLSDCYACDWEYQKLNHCL